MHIPVEQYTLCPVSLYTEMIRKYGNLFVSCAATFDDSDTRSWAPFINLKRYELLLIAHLHMRIVKIQRVGQSARILPIHVKEGDIRGKSTSIYNLVSGRQRSRELIRSRIFFA